MPQIQLPVFPSGTTSINSEIAFEQRDGMVVYLNGHLPVFQHEARDVASFRFFATQLIVNGTASQGQIAKAFGVPLLTVKRCCKKYRERGPAVFFLPASRRPGNRLTPERLVQAQALLDQGDAVAKVAAETGVQQSTIRKAIGAGRLRCCRAPGAAAKRHRVLGGRDTASVATDDGDDAQGGAADEEEARARGAPATTAGARSAADSCTPMGVASGRTLERVAAAVGMLDGAAPAFEPADDVAMGGVLCALPALLSLGLLRHARDTFSLPKGSAWSRESMAVRSSKLRWARAVGGGMAVAAAELTTG